MSEDPPKTTPAAGGDADEDGASAAEQADKRERVKDELGDWRQRAAAHARLPRKPFFQRREIMLVFMLLIALLSVVALKKPCSQGVSRMMGTFDEPDGGTPLRKPVP